MTLSGYVLIVANGPVLKVTMMTEDVSFVRLESTHETGTMVVEATVTQEDLAKIVALIVGDREVEIVEREMH